MKRTAFVLFPSINVASIYLYARFFSIIYISNTNFSIYMCWARAHGNKLRFIRFIVWYPKTIPRVLIRSMTQKCATLLVTSGHYSIVIRSSLFLIAYILQQWRICGCIRSGVSYATCDNINMERIRIWNTLNIWIFEAHDRLFSILSDWILYAKENPVFAYFDKSLLTCMSWKNKTIYITMRVFRDFEKTAC